MGNPGIRYTVDMSEVKRLALSMPQLVNVIELEVEKAMKECGMLLTSIVAAKIGERSSDRGMLRAAVGWPMGFITTGQPISIYEGIVSASTQAKAAGAAPSIYADYVEFGIDPSFPPIEPLEAWVSRKFGLTGEDARNHAEGLQLKIGMTGIKAKWNFRDAWNSRGKRAVQGIWDRVPARVVSRWEREHGV